MDIGQLLADEGFIPEAVMNVLFNVDRGANSVIPSRFKDFDSDVGDGALAEIISEFPRLSDSQDDEIQVFEEQLDKTTTPNGLWIHIGLVTYVCEILNIDYPEDVVEGHKRSLFFEKSSIAKDYVPILEIQDQFLDRLEAIIFDEEANFNSVKDVEADRILSRQQLRKYYAALSIITFENENLWYVVHRKMES